ncbi:MAG: mercury methylation corrinoid protein HgcA [Candidatus Firestonebacteria bacterium]|nr:mercury methylation corrinoid protein HgcA [Candidatus Firestonebacteria bacterium]
MNKFKKVDCGCDTIANCCGGPKTEKHSQIAVLGGVKTKAGDIPVVSAKLGFKDTLGSWRMRWGFGRYSYSIEPGIYAVGKPKNTSPVFVSANYKMSFDKLRKALADIDCFILVLDTKGINVWCAAGKGTFGTEELIKRIKAVNLEKIVARKQVILPQLGAPGVAAHIVAKKTGFKPVYGPVRAEDIPLFMKKGMKADEKMRSVEFPFKERIVLAPFEIIGSLKLLTVAFVLLSVINLFKSGGLNIQNTLCSFLPYLGSAFVGAVLVPALLPWIPGKSFAYKGWLAGLLYVAVIGNMWFPGTTVYFTWLLILPAISAFIVLNFTGCSTYTSLSGVKKEMRYAIPLIVVSALIGIVLNFL